MPSYFILSVIVYGLQIASALPTRKVAKSADVRPHTHEDSYSRSDDLTLYARDASSCTLLTLDQAKSLPGWSKIEQYAKDTWGDGSYNIVVNPPEYPQAGATVCLQDGPIPVQMQGTPSCTTSSESIQGKTDGTTGKITLTTKTGMSSQAQWTVTQESSLAIGVSLSATIGVPDIAKITTSFTSTATITNSLSKSFSTTVDSEQSASLEVKTVDGKPCSGSLDTKTCNIKGTGSARYVASGAIWFNYDDARAPKSDPNGGKHYKYSVDIASVLKNIDDRSSSMTFSGAIQMTSKSNFASNCVPK